MELKEIETERLKLTPFKRDFLDDFYEYASVDGVGECAGWPHHTSKEESSGILDSFIEENNNYALIYKENNKCIGALGLNNSRFLSSQDFLGKFKGKRGIELGYVLSKDYWSKGLMTEAVKAVIDHIFKDNLYDVIIICHYSFNQRSDRVIQKCGLHYWKTIYSSPVPLLNKFYDNLVFYIEKEEYLSKKD